MSRSIAFLLSIALCVGGAQLARGHGFSLTLSGNDLTASSGAANPRLFVGNWHINGDDYDSSHGGAGTDPFGIGKQLRFDVQTTLLYSNGGPAVPAPPGVNLEIASQSLLGGPTNVNGLTPFAAGYPISGNTSHEFLWTLSGDSIPSGVYGVGYIVSGNPNGGAPYNPTPLLVSAWYTPDLDLGNDPTGPNGVLTLAGGAIYEAALLVPEPSSLALAGIGMIGAAALALARRRRRAA